METVASPTDQSDVELHLLTDWGDRDGQRRWREARVLSVVVHAAAIALIFLLPAGVIQQQTAEVRHITPLVMPPLELTQPNPNKGKIAKEVNEEALRPRPRIQIPPSPPSTSRPAAPKPAMPSPPPTPALPEPPKIETAGKDGPKVEVAQVTPPPPQIQAQEQPKLALESPAAPPPPPGRGAGKIAVPNTSISEAVRTVIRGGSGGGLTVGDEGVGAGGIGEGINLPPSPGKSGSALELLSDPMGVDFRPYLIRVLAAVKRNWMAVMPESAKMGRQGRVGIQFAINRNGSVPKLVIVMHSGTDALDRAAVAGISASNPFPQLPTEFKGDQIRLQFTFAYNIPR